MGSLIRFVRLMRLKSSCRGECFLGKRVQCVESALYDSLKRRSVRLDGSHPLVRRAFRERPDLRDVLEEVPASIVPRGEIKRLTGQDICGLHYWMFNPDRGAEPVRIFVEDGDYAYRTLIHEACHAKIAKEYSEIFPFFSFETNETLAELCVHGKLPFRKKGANPQIESEISELTMKEGIREAFKEALWQIGREKCEVAGKEAKEGLNKAIDVVLKKALEIEELDFADREELKEAANEAKKLCLEEKI
mgnify:CR=1 FL=1